MIAVTVVTKVDTDVWSIIGVKIKKLNQPSNLTGVQILFNENLTTNSTVSICPKIT